MGRPKGSKNKPKESKIEAKEETKFPVAVRSILKKRPSEDPIEAKKEEIKQDREKQLFKPKPKTLFDTFLAPSTDPFDWITQAYCEHFKVAGVGFRTNITRWDFPKAIDGQGKRHVVRRQYFGPGKVMIDTFDAGTPVKLINQIKAHLEALGFNYTYILGGETDMKAVFTSRLKKLDPKSKGYPEVKIPANLAEAGFVGHMVSVE